MTLTAMLFLAASAFAKADDGCPVGTQVRPFAPTSLARYTITVSDGGEGDLDGVANGSCDLEVSVCVPVDGCEPATIEAMRTRARGALDRDQRAAAENTFAAAAPGSITSAAAGGEACRPARVTAPALGARSRPVSVRVTAAVRGQKGRRRIKRTKVSVRCVRAGEKAGPAECKASRGGRCPGTVPLTCGDGVRQQGEACDGADAGQCGGPCRTDCVCPVIGAPHDVAPQARLTASSERPSARAPKVVDGELGVPHEWQTDGEAGGAFLRLEWRDPVTIERVVLHDQVNAVDNMTDVSLVFDDGTTVPVGALPADGSPHAVSFSARTVLALTVALTAGTGVSGLGEIQVIAAPSTTPTDPTDPSNPPPASTGPSYYISPNGNDGAAGTSPDKAWRTFARALPALQPGETLVLADGTYTRTTTGLPRIDCGSGNVRSGRADAPITIRAANERRAFLQSDGQQTALEMRGCSWWNIEGLRAANRDASGEQTNGYPVRLDRVDHVNVRRLLASHNNRKENTHVYAVENSTYVVLEECEAYFYHRHAFSVWRSRYVTLRRCYANSMRHGDKGCCSTIDNRPWGDEAFSLYGTSDSIIENSVSENQANGFQIHGISSPLDPSGSGGRNNRVLGSMSVDDSVGLLISSRVSSGKYHNASGNLVRDFVALRTGGHGVYVRGAAGARIENTTVFGGRNAGLKADTGDKGFGGSCSGNNREGCSVVARNVLSMGNTGGGFALAGMPDWRIEWSVANGGSSPFGSSEPSDDDAGRVIRSRTTAPAGVGMGGGQCVLWPRGGSAVATAGADGGPLGADLSRRYEGGRRTEQPLWDPGTGAFPCGAVVPGINDGSVACRNLQNRVNVAGCR